MATINKSRNHIRAKSASAVPSQLPYVNGNVKTNKSLRQSLSITGRNALTSSFQKSVDLSIIENEYIKNLQQQVYFLELECDYLREQLKKVATLPNAMSIDAERMSRKLKTMRSELQHKEQDILQKDSAINVLQHDNENVVVKLANVKESFSNEKKELINEIVCLKKQVEKQELDNSRKETTVDKMRQEFDNTLVSLKDSENKGNVLQAQLNEQTDAFNKLRVQFEETRAECLKVKTEYQELEERFFNSKAKSIEEVDLGLKTELKNLRYELREKELQAEHERTLKLKISEDCAALVKENAALSSQVIELTKHLDRERDFNHDKSLRKQTNIQEMVTLKEERKHLERELIRTNELLDIEKEKYRKLLDKYSSEEESHTRAKLQRSKLKAELEELEGLESVECKENMQLRRDNLLLNDEVTEMQARLREKEEEMNDLKIRFSDLQVSHADLDAKHRRQSNLDSIKWGEFERMADQMKKFSRTMSPMVKSVPPSSSIKGRITELES